MICPSCAAQVPTVVWKLVAAFVAAPLAIAAVVGLVLARALPARPAGERDDGDPR